MCMMPRAAPCKCVCAHCAHRWAACVSPSSRRTTVELNMKVSIIYTWLVKTLHNVLFSFALLLFSSCPLGFFRTLTSLLSLSQCCQPSAAFSTKHVLSGGQAPLFSAPSIVKKRRSCLSSTAIVSARESN